MQEVGVASVISKLLLLLLLLPQWVVAHRERCSRPCLIPHTELIILRESQTHPCFICPLESEGNQGHAGFNPPVTGCWGD